MSNPHSSSDQLPGESTLKLQGPVVGISIGAGGGEAAKALFTHIPHDCGMSFVIIQDLAPDATSQLAEVLASTTRMPVRWLTGPAEVEINHIYLARPDSVVAMKDGALVPLSQEGSHRSPVDYFFRSLAHSYGENAVGIILSGAGSDGTLGLQAIKRFGGLTLVQSPETARFDAMPKAALAAGVVDHALTVEAMPTQIVSYFAFRAQNAAGDGEQDEMIASLPVIFKILQDSLGHDFSSYKQSTLIRRIRRRMQMLRIKPPEAYADVLGKTPREAEELFRDLIIGVTEFFRDTEAFATLARIVIPKLFQQLSPSGTLRVWVAGCATGEEAYSLAILLREHMIKTGENHPVQIFATDIDADAVETARQGFYKEEISEQISPERLARFFHKREGGYQVHAELREMCVFSVHNLVQDPPFSRMDFISCRNVLIYFDAALQKRVLPLFQYALNPHGFLFLGPAESLGGLGDLFLPVDKKLRIFQAKANSTAPSVRVSRPDIGRLTRTVHDTSLKVKLARERDARELHEQALLEWYVAPSVLLDGQGEVLHFARQTAGYLQLPVGAPSNNIFDIVRDELRVVLRAALTQAKKDGAEIKRRHVPVSASEHITLIVRPLRTTENVPDRFLVVFREEDAVPPPDFTKASSLSEEAEAVHQLERELRVTKQWLQTTIEDLENSNEELKSSNEELISINEEYQSANEALQTSKEELQSLNEELETVNTELSKKVDELDVMNVEMRSLFASSAVATVFLDSDLRIKKFTSAASQLFSLIDTDVGRLLSDITARFDASEMIRGIREAADGVNVPEIAITTPDDNCSFVCRISAIFGNHPKPIGIVLNVIDVTELKHAQDGLQEAAARKDEFLAILGHELRNPLAPLTMGLSVLKAEGSSQKEKEEIYDIFHRQVSHLAQIVDDLLDVSRISKGIVNLRMEPLNLSELADATIADYRSLLDSRNIDLGIDIESKVWINGDRTRMRQVLSNLLTNAAKFTPSGGRVVATLRQENGNAIFSLKDSGCGLDKRTMQKLFQPLSQGVMTIDRQGAGLGLGLALVKGLTELHRGTVKVTSPGLGEGATFRIEIPLTSVRPGEISVSTPRKVQAHRIVIIEDNEDAARALEMVLKFHGHEVAIARNGRAGIDLVRQTGADAVICDIGLPGDVDGYGVARELRALKPVGQLLLVAATGYGLPSDKDKAIQAGFDCHLTKPIDIAQVEQLFGVSARSSRS